MQLARNCTQSSALSCESCSSKELRLSCDVEHVNSHSLDMCRDNLSCLSLHPSVQHSISMSAGAGFWSYDVGRRLEQWRHSLPAGQGRVTRRAKLMPFPKARESNDDMPRDSRPAASWRHSGAVFRPSSSSNQTRDGRGREWIAGTGEGREREGGKREGRRE